MHLHPAPLWPQCHHPFSNERQNWSWTHQCMETTVPQIVHVMDKETSNNLIWAIRKQKVPFQLVPLCFHKNHLIVGLCSVKPQFPKNLWADLLPQAALTLNLLQPACYLNPKQSAYAALEGTSISNKPSQCSSWTPQELKGWYIGPALQHFQCIQCYIPSTHGLHIANAIHFLDHQALLPTFSADDTIIAAAHKLTNEVKNPASSLHPSPAPLAQTMKAIQDLATIFPH